MVIGPDNIDTVGKRVVSVRPNKETAFNGGSAEWFANGINIVDTLFGRQRCSALPHLTLYPEVGHNAWKEAYADPQLYEWLLVMRQKTGSYNPVEKHA